MYDVTVSSYKVKWIITGLVTLFTTVQYFDFYLPPVEMNINIYNHIIFN